MKRCAQKVCTADYSEFTTPYAGIAAMVFMQTHADLLLLEGRESICTNGSVVNKWEIINFLRSAWAERLGSYLGIGRAELDAYEARMLG